MTLFSTYRLTVSWVGVELVGSYDVLGLTTLAPPGVSRRRHPIYT